MSSNLDVLRAMTAEELATAMLLADDDEFVTKYLTDKEKNAVLKVTETQMMSYYETTGEWLDIEAWTKRRAEAILGYLQGADDELDSSSDH